MDARFLLPDVPTTAQIVGSLPEWEEGLRTAGVEVVAESAEHEPDVVVARAEDVRRALAFPARSYLFLGGDVRRSVRHPDLTSVAYLGVPDLAGSEWLVPLGQQETVAYFYDALRVAPRRAVWYRNRMAARLIGRGVSAFLPKGQLLTVVARHDGPPAALRAASDDRNTGADGWVLGLGPSHAERRVVFSVFEGGGRVPSWVAKLDRLPVEAEEPGARGGPPDARPGGDAIPFDLHAPATLGEVSFDRRIVTVEQAAAGFVLTDYLRGPFARDRKLAALREVAEWLVGLAVATADWTGGQSCDAVPPASDDGGPGEHPHAYPTVYEHGDLWSGNVVFRPGDGFSVVDWADADPHGMPLRDLIYFLSDSLAVVDGADTDERRDAHFRSLFRGELPSSRLVFEWVRTMVAALGIDPAAVGPLATIGWESLAAGRERQLELSHAAIRASMGPDAVEPAVRKARVWQSDPVLGERWTAWSR